MASLNWGTPSGRDEFKNGLSAKLDGIPCYDKDVSHGEDMEGNPQSAVDCRPEETADADDLYSWIKGKMNTIPALKGKVTIHDCKHDEGPPFESCRIQKEYSV